MAKDVKPIMEEVGGLPTEPKRKQARTVRAKETPAVEVIDTKDVGPSDVTLDPGDTSGKFTPLEGAKTLMSVMATIHESKGHECCATMYERQKMPVAFALNELAKDMPMLQSWITHGKAFKWIALIAATEPLVEHQWRDHLRPSMQQRRMAQEEAYYAAHPEDDPRNYDEHDNYLGPIIEPQDNTVAPPAPAPFRGHDGRAPEEAPTERMSPDPVRTDHGPRPDGTTVAGNGAVIPAPANAV